MTAAQRKHATTTDTAEEARKPRTDPRRLKAFAQRLNLMLGEMGLPERGRAKHIKERVGVSGTTAANWLRGQSYPSFEELARMGRLGVNPVLLFPDAAELARTSAKTSIAASAVSKHLARLIGAGEVMALPQLQSDNGEWDHTAMPNGLWRQLLGRDLGGFVVLRMKGDAMAERIRDGAPLLLDTNMTQITDDNGIYALLLGEAVIVRRVQRRLQGGFVIACDNPSIASEIVNRLGSHREGSASARDLLVLGRVAAAVQKL